MMPPIPIESLTPPAENGASREPADSRPRSRVALSIVFVLTDVVLFQRFLANGVSLSASHLASFGLALLPPFSIAVVLALRRSRRAPERGQILGFVFLALLIVLLRGGLVAVWVDSQAGWAPAQFLPASILTTFGLIGSIAMCMPFGIFTFAALGPVRRTRVWFPVAYLFALRTVYLSGVELLPDEAYYWQYAEHLALSYLDHPPLVGWLIWGATSLLGHHEWVIRLAAWLAWLIMAGYLAALTRNLFGDRSAVYALLLVSGLPIYFGAGFLMTPDILCFAAWAAALYYGKRALVGEDPAAWSRMGLALGLGFLAKYSVALLAGGLLLFMICDRRGRTWFGRFEPYRAVAIAVVVSTPVLLWNAEHDWMSFSFQSTRRLAVTPSFSLHFVALHVSMLLTPIGAIAAFFALKKRWPVGDAGGSDSNRIRRFLFWVTLFPLGVVMAFSLQHYPRFHWTGAIWLGAIPLMARGIEQVRDLQWDPWWARSWTASLSAVALFYAVILHILALGLPGMAYPSIADYFFWRDAVPVIEELRSEFASATGTSPVVVGMSKWSIASALTFYDRRGALGEVTARHLFACRASMYEDWQPPEVVIGKPVLLIGHKWEHLVRPYIDDRLVGASPVGVREVMRDGVTLRRVLYRTAERYLGPRSARGIAPPPFDCGTGAGTGAGAESGISP